MPLRLLLCLALVAPAAAETREEFDANRRAIDAYWEALKAKAPEGDLSRLTGAEVYDPAFISGLTTDDQRYYFDHKARMLMKAVVEKRSASEGPERELALLFQDSRAPKGNGANQVMKENPAVRELLWNAVHGGPSGEAQRKRILDGYAEAKKAKPDLTLKDYLLGLSGPALTAALAGDKVKEKEEGERPKEERAPAGERRAPASEQARAAAGGDVLASVGFDGSQAYGVFGDRHVYKDKAGNQVSFSISSRRMPDGTVEDVVHVVNINNRAAPQGATFSLRGEADKLAAGVTVTVGGVALTLSVKPSGDDHAVSLSGPAGAFANAKGEGPMSLNQSYAYRAARVFNYGRVVEIGGKEYYVSPETYTQNEGPKDGRRSVGYGQFAYWPKDALDALFAPRAGRDEVDPQTFDFRSIDLQGSRFASVRDMRPEFIATVIRREGAQDVALPRASMGQDAKGQWWDAVLRDGQYVVEKGQPPAVGHTPDSTTPPGQVRSDGWPQLQSYSPDGPEAARLNALLATARVKVYEATGASEFDKKFIIMFDKDFKSIVHPQFVGAGTPQFTQALGLEVLGGKVIAARSNLGVSYMDAAGSGFRDGRPDLKMAGTWSPDEGFRNVSDAAALGHALGLSGYSEADAKEILKRLADQAASLKATSFSVGGPKAGSKLPVAAGFNREGGASLVMNLWPALGTPEPGGAGPSQPGAGLALDPAAPFGVVHLKFEDTLGMGDKTLTFVSGPRAALRGAAVYRNGDAHYVVFTITAGSGSPRRYYLHVPSFKGGALPAGLSYGDVTMPRDPAPGELKFEQRTEGGKTGVAVLSGTEVVGWAVTWPAA